MKRTQITICFNHENTSLNGKFAKQAPIFLKGKWSEGKIRNWLEKSGKPFDFVEVAILEDWQTVETFEIRK
ncbi:TPA: hypothetical protein QB618_001515 [Pasteurella multocida]|uniref:hypothetical protein n=1 Tax=Pasteurella multocida TaxID=747 RepID=UPI000214548B|nr:hypothetical protein [Pasteurella multocida]EGP02931.1 hypothetical protein AAUPMG_12146 [Pasteurella multocida subsp. multocida str. Anand1_goat]MCT8984562.1 hypothetical protein [Pasteurella multocida]HDR1113223.1 hypothetical protein [Pasteurella multocida]HDR1847028.1 hypothetical protein [Pasteurella multocida]